VGRESEERKEGREGEKESKFRAPLPPKVEVGDLIYVWHFNCNEGSSAAKT